MCRNCLHGQDKLKSNPRLVLEDISHVTSVKSIKWPLPTNDQLAIMFATLLPHVSMLHALRVLRGHSINRIALRTVYQAIVISRLLYAASAWWRFTIVADHQHIDAFICCGICAGFCDKTCLLCLILLRTLTRHFEPWMTLNGPYFAFFAGNSIDLQAD